jgi:hypothetical protein
MEHKREMWLMLSRTGVLVVGVTSVVRGREGESKGERAPLSTCLCLHVPLRPPQRPPLRKALDIPFIDARRCPVVQRGVAMRYVAGGEVP